jgi:hypothetical protein
MTTHDENGQPIDPVTQAAETLLYGDPETAAVALRKAIHSEASRMVAHQAANGRIHAAHRKSMTALQRFVDDNDAFKDPAIQAAGRSIMAQEQLRDLEAIGFDRQKFEEAEGRKLNEQDVFNAHLEFRANGIPGIRSDDELLDATAGHLEDKFGIRRRLSNIDRNRQRAITERKRVSAQSHGVDLEDYQTNFEPHSRQPNLDSGEVVTAETMHARERREAGEGGEDLTAKRSAAFKKYFEGRGQGTDRRPGAPRDDVRLSRTADDARYPDRRGAEG